MQAVINTTITILLLAKPVVCSSCYTINNGIHVVHIVMEEDYDNRLSGEEIVVRTLTHPAVVCRLQVTADGLLFLDLDQYDLVGKSFRMFFPGGRELRFINSDLDPDAA